MNLSTNLPQDARALACSEFLQHQNVSKLMQKLSQATDALLLQLWNESGLHHDYMRWLEAIAPPPTPQRLVVTQQHIG